MTLKDEITRDGTFRKYLAVRHLSNEKAAIALGLKLHTVRTYRTVHKQALAAGPAVPMPVARPGIVRHVVAVTSPTRSSEVSATPTMAVSLPRPPEGITFGRYA